jgi:hypothetical protein
MEDFSQYLVKEPITPTDIGARRQSQMEAAKTFATNVGRGATLGLVKYPAAGLQMGMRALTGAPVGTFGENVADVADFYRQQEQQSPNAALAGQVLGGLAAAPGAGGTLPAIIGRTALAGGVSGFTEQERLEDALKGAAFGAGAAGLLGGAGKLTEKTKQKVARNVYINNQLDFAENRKELAMQNAAALRPTVDKVIASSTMIPGKPIQTEKVLRDIAAGRTMVPVTTEEANLAKELLRNNRLSNLATKRAAQAETLTGKELYDKVQKSSKYEALRSAKSFAQLTSESIPSITLGSVSGAGLGALMGYDPAVSAGVGAGLGGLYGVKQAFGPVMTKAVGAIAARGTGTGATPETLARAATIGTVPQLVREELPNEFEQYSVMNQPPEPIDTRTRLQSLADQFRAKFGTQ